MSLMMLLKILKKLYIIINQIQFAQKRSKFSADTEKIYLFSKLLCTYSILNTKQILSTFQNF
jgi:hypothetical protein